MKRLILGSILLLTPVAYGQQASLAVEPNRLSADGGSLTFTATATYEQAPNALGWSIKLPAGWSLQRTGGAQVPEIVPASGTTSPLEWAYVAVPATQAQFEFTAHYPAGLSTNQTVTAELIVRVDGQTKSAAVQSLVLRPSATRPNRPGVREK
jgi:hypothetical protein